MPFVHWCHFVSEFWFRTPVISFFSHNLCVAFPTLNPSSHKGFSDFRICTVGTRPDDNWNSLRRPCGHAQTSTTIRTRPDDSFLGTSPEDNFIGRAQTTIGTRPDDNWDTPMGRAQTTNTIAIRPEKFSPALLFACSPAARTTIGTRSEDNRHTPRRQLGHVAGIFHPANLLSLVLLLRLLMFSCFRRGFSPADLLSRVIVFFFVRSPVQQLVKFNTQLFV